MAVGPLAAAGVLIGLKEFNELQQALRDLKDTVQALTAELRRIPGTPAASRNGQTAAAAVRPGRYRVISHSLTVARLKPTPLAVWGQSLLVLWAPDDAQWSLRLSDPGNDPIPGRFLPTGSYWPAFRFSELYLENAAAPEGTEPLVLYVEQS